MPKKRGLYKRDACGNIVTCMAFGKLNPNTPQRDIFFSTPQGKKYKISIPQNLASPPAYMDAKEPIKELY